MHRWQQKKHNSSSMMFFSQAAAEDRAGGLEWSGSSGQSERRKFIFK
jgi:hypothetical protein